MAKKSNGKNTAGTGKKTAYVTSAKQSGGKNNKNNKNKKKSNHWGTRLFIVIVVAAALGVSFLFENQIDRALGLRYEDRKDYDGTPIEDVTGEGIVALGSKMTLHFVDVGQGDSCIIELPDDKLMIIDGGEDKEKEKILTYIDSNIRDAGGEKITGFDYAVLTHSDSDHSGGLDDVLKDYPAKIFYRPNQLASYKGFTDPAVPEISTEPGTFLRGDYKKYAPETATYARTIEEGYKKAEKVYVTDARDDDQNCIKPEGKSAGEDGYYEINFYTPTVDVYTANNNYSPVMILTYENKRVALSGDAEARVEKEFLELAEAGQGRYAVFADSSFAVDVINLGHHGSNTSNTEDYLAFLTKGISIENRKNVAIVISCGLNNKHKHPTAAVLERLEQMGFSNILRTDLNSDVVLSVRQDESAVYQLFYGAEMIRREAERPLTWREIAIIIAVVVFTIVILQPLIFGLKKEAKKAARKATRKK